MERNNAWLDQCLRQVWHRYFTDIEESTPVSISFGQRSYRRLGSIALRRGMISKEFVPISRITISALLTDQAIPELVIEHIIAHELVHYVHGFGSERPRSLRHPHQGGVIISEFQKRGVWELYRAYQAWMKVHWKQVLAQEGKD